MSKLHEAIRTGTEIDIVAAAILARRTASDTVASLMAEAIVAARPKPEDVFTGTVWPPEAGIAGELRIDLDNGPHPMPGDRVTITREPDK